MFFPRLFVPLLLYSFPSKFHLSPGDELLQSPSLGFCFCSKRSSLVAIRMILRNKTVLQLPVRNERYMRQLLTSCLSKGDLRAGCLRRTRGLLWLLVLEVQGPKSMTQALTSVPQLPAVACNEMMKPACSCPCGLIHSLSLFLSPSPVKLPRLSHGDWTLNNLI